MCGFLVQFSKESGDFKNFEDANNLLEHRGPDNTDYYQISDNCKFGFKRLSILDLDSSANQPMVDHENRYVIVFNGEIYNFKQLRNEIQQYGGKFITSHSDTEVILEGYKKWGKEILNKLEGQFSFVIYDKVNQVLFMARDRVGQKPLFYKITNEKIIISSTLEPIIKLSKSFEVDLESVYTFLQVGVVPAPKTIFKNINKLKNGEYILFDVQENHIIEKLIYWSPELFIDYKKFNYDEFISIFDEAVKKRCVADVEISSFLSGGLDSTSIIKKSI
jgi:asparagine synthase (glutamine-hydrolysing)